MNAWLARLPRLRASASGNGLTAAVIYQIATYLIPLTTFPYLARMLGVEGFGLVGLAVAIVGYALMITDWAFGLTATQAVAQNRDDPIAVNRIIWATLLAKAGLGAVCAGAIAIGALFAPAALRPVLWVSTIGVFGAVISVDWALRGVEAMTSFAATAVIGRLAVVPLVFILVRGPGDADMAVLITALGGVITGFLSLGRAVQMGLLRWPDVKLSDALRALNSGAYVFASMAITTLYTNTIIVGLGFVAGPAQVGLFAATDRLKRPISSLLSPISLVFFPRMSALGASDPEAAERLARRLLLVQGGAALVLTLALTAAAPLIVRLLLGEAFMSVVPVLRLQAWLIFLIGVSNVQGMMIMLPFGMKRAFTLCILSGAVVGLSLLLPLARAYGAFGASLAAVLAELSVTATMLFALGRRFSWLRIGGVRYA